MDVTLTGVSKRAARRKLERGGHRVGASVEVIQHLRGDDQPTPGEQARRRGEPGVGESLGERSPRNRKQLGKIIPGEVLMRPSHRYEHGVPNRRIERSE